MSEGGRKGSSVGAAGLVPSGLAGGPAGADRGVVVPEERDDLVFKALASATRRRMLDALRDAPMTTGQLCGQFPELDRTTVLQHLRVLEKADLVIGRKVGRERHLTLAPLPIKRIHDRWIGAYTRAAVDLIDRLGADE